MNSKSLKKYQLDNYKKFLLNRGTANKNVLDYIEDCLSREDEAAPHSFHKIMVVNWNGSNIELFETLSEYFSPTFVPINFIERNDIASFYTSSLVLVSKIAKLDFMFPHARNMYNVDILFNDKSSLDCFENFVTIDDIVSGVVNGRYNEKQELDLSNFCNDPEFIEKNMHFYKLSLLSNFKILMLRMGKDVKMLNISNNNLSRVPGDILNFFIKGELTAVNISDNNIPSVQELHRISSKIEKLWTEGNPLCAEIDPISYVKLLGVKFPRLNELDGVKLNEHGVMMPFFKNYLEIYNKKTKMVVEKFLSLYFGHYDAPSRKQIGMFYHENTQLTISTGFKESEENQAAHYVKVSRNMLKQSSRLLIVNNAKKSKSYRTREAVKRVFEKLPLTTHDPISFTVDVLKHDKKTLVLVIDGVFTEKGLSKVYYSFRRSFVFAIYTKNNKSEYFITNEIYHISFATSEQIENCVKNPSRSTNPLALWNPDREEAETICNILSHITRLKKTEALSRLKSHEWDFKATLRQFLRDMGEDKVPMDSFMDDNFSGTSSPIHQ